MRIEKTEQCKTKNGLRYYLFPRTGFGEQMAAVLVQRGANHLFWKGRDGEKICFPQGTAHFIEHKLFQQEWGDAFARFTQNGASANAFTDGDRTVYYFTCSDKFTENLRLLLDFVQKPYFTKGNIEFANRNNIKLVAKLNPSVTQGFRKKEDEFQFNKDAGMYVWKAPHPQPHCGNGGNGGGNYRGNLAEGVRMLLHNGRNGADLRRGYPFG